MNKASPAGTRFGGASKLGKERTGSASADMNGRKSVLTHSMPVFRRRPITESSGSRELARVVVFWQESFDGKGWTARSTAVGRETESSKL